MRIFSLHFWHKNRPHTFHKNKNIWTTSFFFHGPDTKSVSAFWNVQPELPLQRGPAGAGRSKTSIRVTTLIYGKCRYCTSNRSAWMERGSFPVSCGVNCMTSGFLYTSQSTFSFLISAFCRSNFTFFKNDRKTQSLGEFWLLSLCY